MKTTLRDQIKQGAPFGSLEQEVFLNVLRTAAVLEHAVATRLKPYGLTLTQYNVLRILRGAGPEGLCRNEVGARLLSPVPDATRLLDRMVDAGLVLKEREGVDRRYVTTRITDHGLELLRALDGPVGEMHHALLGHLSREELAKLAHLLEAARVCP